MPGERLAPEHRELVVIGLNLCRNKAGLDEASMEALLTRDAPTVAAFQEVYEPARPAIGRTIENLGYQAIFPAQSKMDLAFAVSPELRIVGTNELVFPGKVGRSISTKGPWARELGLFSIQVVEEGAVDAKPDRITTAHDPTYIMLPARRAVSRWRSVLMPGLTKGVNVHAFALDHNSVAWQERGFDRDQAAWGGQRLLSSGQVTYERPSRRSKKRSNNPETKGFALDSIHASVSDDHELVDLSTGRGIRLKPNQVGFQTEVKDVKGSDHRAIITKLSLSEQRREQERSQDDERAKLRPDLEVDSILDITPELLEEMGIQHILIDLDNTLLAPDEKQIRQAFIEHLLHLRQSGSIQTLSLATESMRNVRKIARPLGRYKLFRHFLSRGKPIFKSNPQFYSRILEDLGADPSTVLMIGDEYLRDILTANQVGIKTAKVAPLGKDYRIFKRRRKRDTQALQSARSIGE